MFLKSAWYVAGWSSEFEAGPLHSRTVMNEPLVLTRRGDGTLVALTDRCPHRWAPLSRVGSKAIRSAACIYGVRFGMNGRCVEVPRQDKVPRTLDLRSFPVVERHRWAWVWMGKADQADPALIPDASLLDDGDRRVSVGQLDYRANYMLVNDNLLDLSHVGFVHENTLGRRLIEGEAPPPPVTGGSPSIASGAGAQLIERGVRNDTWYPGKTPLMPDAVPFGDVWIRVDYMVPGVFLQRVRLFPRGTAEACRGGEPAPDLASLADFMSCQAVTPMTETTTRYFYSAGNRASDMDEAEAAAKFRIVEVAFHEDTLMIEAQQRMITEHPGKRMNWINADRGLSLFRSLMERLTAAESHVG